MAEHNTEEKNEISEEKSARRAPLEKAVEEREETPIGQLKERIKKYVDDPSLVDKQTLMELLAMVENIEQDVEGSMEETEENESEEGSSHNDNPGKSGLAIIISKAKRR